MKISVNAMKAYGLVSLALAAGLFVSLSTSNWSWLARSGAAIVVIGNALFAVALAGSPDQITDSCQLFLARGKDICDGAVELPETLREQA